MSSDGAFAGPSPVDTSDPVEESEKARQLWAAAPMVRAMCAARLRGRDSEDAAQDVLERVWRAQHQQEFDDEGVRRYAAALARLVPPNHDRRSVRSSPTGELGEHVWADATKGPEEAFERSEAVAEAAARVQALLDRLSPREREIIRATRLGERSTAEVAAELGLTPSGVRSAQTRAMARMREIEQARSPNPLASELSERGRRREARVRLAEDLPEGPQGRRAAETAQRFAVEQGRLPSRSELSDRAEVGSGTAQRVVRALRDRQDAPAVTTPIPQPAGRAGDLHDHRPDVAAQVEARPQTGDPSRDGDDPLDAPVLVATDRRPHADVDDRESSDGHDPLERARDAVGRASARGTVEEPSGEDGARREQLALWRLDDLHASGGDEHDTGDLDTCVAAPSGASR